MGQSYAVLVINKEVSVKICCLLRAVQLVTSPGKLCFFGMKNSRSLNAACISIANHNFKSCQCLVYACFVRLWFFKKNLKLHSKFECVTSLKIIEAKTAIVVLVLRKVLCRVVDCKRLLII